MPRLLVDDSDSDSVNDVDVVCKQRYLRYVWCGEDLGAIFTCFLSFDAGFQNLPSPREA